MASSIEKNGLVEHFKEWACSFSSCDGAIWVVRSEQRSFTARVWEKIREIAGKGSFIALRGEWPLVECMGQ